MTDDRAAKLSHERDLRMQALSDEIVSLHERVGALHQEKAKIFGMVDLSKGPTEYERLRTLRAPLDQAMTALGEEIARAQTELRRVQSESAAFNAAPSSHEDALRDTEIADLRRRLHAVTDGQRAAVAAWNANPIPERRAALEETLTRLHAEFEALSRKKAELKAQRT